MLAILGFSFQYDPFFYRPLQADFMLIMTNDGTLKVYIEKLNNLNVDQ